MKISTQLAALATVVACAFSIPSYAQTTYECETGFSDEKFNISIPSNDDVTFQINFFPLKTFYKYTEDYYIIRSDYASEVEFQIALLNAILTDTLMDVEDGKDDEDDYFASYSCSNCDSYFFSNSYSSESEDYEIVDAEVSIRNGNPTLQYVFVDNDFNECEAVRIIVTEHGAYSLFAYFTKDAEIDYQAVFDSFRIVE